MTTPGGSTTPVVDRTAALILDLTKTCLCKFDEALASQTLSSKEGLENRLADFNLWVDGVGAMAKSGLSLDSRLQSRPNDLAMVKSVLLMLSDSLDYYASLSQVGKGSDHGIQNIDSAIRNLALIGVAIRRTGKASRSRRADRTFDPDEHTELRKHLECLLLLRPTEEGRHSDELDPGKLSALQRRLIDANLRRRHRFLLAQKRSRDQKYVQAQHPGLETTPSVDDTPGKGTRPEGSQDHPPTPSGRHKDPHLAPTISGFSRASTAEGTMKYTPAPTKRYTPGVTKTQITFIAADVEFPEPPVIPGDREIFQCPCCCQSLHVATFKDPKLWKQHVVEDLCPYTCIAENCPTPQLLFCTRNEWEVHVKKNHLPRWQCPFCDEDAAKQPNMEAMEIHLQTDHRDELSDNSLSTLLSWSAVQAMGIKTCPFCSSHGPEDAPDLVDHVLREGYEFALRALPWPKPIDHDLNEPPGVFNFSDRDDGESLFGRWIREPVLEDENAVDLELCPYDRADHSEPINFDEYTDYFDKGGYFGDKAGDNSSAAEANTAHSKSMSAEDYTVGWVCALAIEHIAATGMLDEIHPDTISKPANDPNGYTLGSIGGHNIVIACLPEGQYGTNSPATVATWMVSTFPRIRFGLMVGIGSGVPPKVRLGDVVVGCPVAQFPGVVQWDMGKAKAGGKFELAGALNNPPRVLLAALGKLKVDHEIVGTKVPEYLRGMVQKWPRLSEYLRSDALEDVLFKATYPHVEADEEDEEAEEESVNCPNCSRTMTVERRPRDAKVHYGLIASANRVIKDALLRDQLSKDLGKEVLCLEMEAAGLMNNFPCIVIRGICDYADSHKNRDWQRHAAAMAAGFAKELLQYVSPADVDEEPTVKDILAQLNAQVPETSANVAHIKSDLEHRLFKAAATGDVDTVRLLIRLGVDLEAKGHGAYPQWGGTALLEAIVHGQEQMARLLIESGASKTTRDDYSSRTPLQWAEFYDMEEIIPDLS